MRILTAFILLMSWCAGATTFTEFYCDTSNGSTNINAGSTTNSAAVYSSVNGNWDGTSVYTPTDGSTPANTVSAGMWAAIFIDGSTNLIQTSAGGCVMLITNVAAGANGAITFERSAFMGTAPSSSATGRSINVGGCWNGPYRTISFPFGFAATTGTNGPQAMPRINLRNTAQYNITAAMTHANAGPTRFQGMTSSPGDGGRATIDGGSTGTSYVLLTSSGVNLDFADLIFANNGNSGSANLLAQTGGAQTWIRCVAHDSHRSGFVPGGATVMIECEAYACNKANASSHAGFLLGTGRNTLIRCISHDNSGSAAVGFLCTENVTFIGCISDSNGSDGFRIGSTTSGLRLLNCDSYANGASGLDITGTSALAFYAENCNFFLNTAYGITSSGSSLRSGSIVNCCFGSGTKTNTSGNLASNLGGLNVIGTVTYTADQVPWTDPANGDFRIASTATLVKASGRGAFTQTAASYTGTVAYPDIGAAQSASTNATAAASGGAYTWAQ